MYSFQVFESCDLFEIRVTPIHILDVCLNHDRTNETKDNLRDAMYDLVNNYY